MLGKCRRILGRVVVMQHLDKSMDFFRGMRLLLLLLRCSALFLILADAGGAETGFYLLHIYANELRTRSQLTAK